MRPLPHDRNLRGLRESGNIVAVRTSVFVGLALTIVVRAITSRSGRHTRCRAGGSVDRVIRPPHRAEQAIVPVPGINRAVVQALNVARSISDAIRAVHISTDPQAATHLRRRWEQQMPRVALVAMTRPASRMELQPTSRPPIRANHRRGTRWGSDRAMRPVVS
ncbi:MAG TPA: hypothetical protein VNF73_11900 [Candidatus Saccharimonadales bacterium]|nr:hypothetical protein [Candidatus Saccharimonadales bacterium]